VFFCAETERAKNQRTPRCFHWGLRERTRCAAPIDSELPTAAFKKERERERNCDDGEVSYVKTKILIIDTNNNNNNGDSKKITLALLRKKRDILV
jgi:hypothetical protein